jgi:hypothetical protein
MRHYKYKACDAPSGLEITSGDLFGYECDSEYNGICLLTYSREQKNDQDSSNDEDVRQIIIPETINGLPVVGVDSECFDYGIAVYYPDTVK